MYMTMRQGCVKHTHSNLSVEPVSPRMQGLSYHSNMAVEKDNKIYPLNTGGSTPKLKSLQCFCRKAILKALTIKRLGEVDSLPLPHLLRNYLCTFNIPGDFDIEGHYMDYHSCYPHHLHHYTHQVYPCVYVIDGSVVLLKTQNIKEKCGTCDASGKGKPCSVNLWKHWINLDHENLLKCHMALSDECTDRLCFVLEFPGISLLDFMTKIFNLQKTVPELTIWFVLLKLTSVLIYLKDNGIIPWELVRPENVCITKNGEIKLESLLLYLPATSGPLFELMQSPEQKRGYHSGSNTTVWGLGTILHELTVPIPRVLRKDGFASRGTIYSTWLSPALYNEVSMDLTATILDCLNPCPLRRPSLYTLQERAKRKLLDTHEINLLELIEA